MNDIQELSVDVTAEDGWVTVTVAVGDAVSSAVVERVGDPAIAKNVPIGTRKAANLRMLVNDEAARLRPGPGRFARGSYKVAVVHDSVTYRLRPKSPDTSRLTRDGVRLGDFELKSDGSVSVDWFEENRDSVTPTDAAIGYALATAFGTGAQFFLLMLFDVVGAAGPD
ncbi:hypothetical protein QLQ12_11050 [Actinoplanes sp. NEAU-A12]|uniref:Uncharacterized protein n=1 Tax=Actinoplanes sandaracinus TaxID=3045177 RepID=A0ABT6WHC4_9ACTN|nr:hypothetical protein [Actinoplanes sandaracinus]MDI6099134.1 hypothetical protein [Actinoplanes sandaracinus]